jgi:hypothetical protein
VWRQSQGRKLEKAVKQAISRSSLSPLVSNLGRISSW